jgi:O-antigen/teichoic acid export membrane protein
LLRIGLPLTASTLVQIGRYRIFAVLIGGTAGATALGQIHVAFRLADTIREITVTALWRLMLPILSEHQHHSKGLAHQVDRLLRLSSFVTMPMCGGMVVTLLPVTALILGPAWRDAGLAAEPLVGLTALLALMFPSGAALTAVGRARFALYANLAGSVATVAGVLVIRPATPWAAVLVWCGAQLFVSPYSLWVNGRALGVGPLRPLREGAPMLLVSSVAAVAALALGGDHPLRSLVTRPMVFLAFAAAGAGFLQWRSRAQHGEGLRPGIVLAEPANPACRSPVSEAPRVRTPAPLSRVVTAQVPMSPVVPE